MLYVLVDFMKRLKCDYSIFTEFSCRFYNVTLFPFFICFSFYLLRSLYLY